MKIKALFPILLLLAGPLLAAPLSEQPKVAAFIQKVSKKHHLNAENVTKIINTARIDNDIVAKMQHPYEAKPWHFYRSHFVTKRRIKLGARFWQKHEKLLSAIEKKYGVPASIIVAIVGVESFYGERAGHHKVLDALATLSFAYPPREKYFQYELEQFLLLTQEENVSAKSLLGSYAGAIGQPQFMPSSYRRYSVDYDQDGHRDLQHNIPDILASIAFYLKQKGWKPEQPIAQPAQQRRGKRILELAGKEQPEYWRMFDNFKVIMRYNTSSLYAMAVYQLSEEIKAWKQSHPHAA